MLGVCVMLVCVWRGCVLPAEGAIIEEQGMCLTRNGRDVEKSSLNP